MKQEKPHLKKSTGITPREYSIIFLCLGIVFFFIGLYFLQKVIHLHNNGIVITGTVVDYKLEIKGYKVRDFADYFKVDTTEGVF